MNNRYAVVQVTDGSFSLISEHGTLDSARVKFFSLASALWGDSSNFVATVAILDENLRVVGGYSEYIDKSATESSDDTTTTEG